MDTDGGGWTVFQRRMDGSVDFYLGWRDYVHGFGNITREHWMGLSKLHRLANGSISTPLRIDMKDKNGNKGYAEYSGFYISGSPTDYILHVSGYSGTVGDSLFYNNNRKFCTKDNDNDGHSNANLAEIFHGGWWYHGTQCCNLNGRYNSTGISGISWVSWRPHHHTLPFVEMKLRRA